ncbi:MAG: WYL domain-containing protein [Gemmatimonadota bacterium]
MSRTDSTAAAQLERILYILPVAARDGDARIEDIARALGVEPKTVMRDLEDATARAFHHPAGATESFTISTDGRTVQVHAPQEFRRPVRLNEREALALGLGLRTLAADADAGRRAEILAFAARLEAELTTQGTAADDDVEYDYDELAVAFDDDGFRSIVADASELRRCCTIWYLKPGDEAPSHRSIAPYRLIYASGRWYVIAHDMERDGLRFFRMDRVLDAALNDDEAPEPTTTLHEMLAQGVPYHATDEVEVSVRYSPRVARWIVEHAAVPLEEDGTVLLRHRVADPRWIVRHVLQYGGDAVVEEPPPVRRWVAAAAARARRAGTPPDRR